MSDCPEPPFLLDSARVLMYAETGGRNSYTGRITVFVSNALLDPVPRLAICEELVENRVLLMHCDNSWKVLAAGFCRSIDAALESAERGYLGISSKWKQYRDLSSEEIGEIDEERQYLRNVAKEFPLNGNDPHAV